MRATQAEEAHALTRREVGAALPGYSFYCKSDDDTLVHLDRLHAVGKAGHAESGIDRQRVVVRHDGSEEGDQAEAGVGHE